MALRADWYESSYEAYSKNTTIPADVSRRRKREKGDRSCSNVIAAHLDGGGILADITGYRLSDNKTTGQVADIEALSEGTIDRRDE